MSKAVTSKLILNTKGGGFFVLFMRILSLIFSCAIFSIFVRDLLGSLKYFEFYYFEYLDYFLLFISY